jgi:hypothetical protein
VYAQDVLCVDDGNAAWYGVPGPLHVTDPPSPMSQVTEVGTAVAVAVTAPVVALTE